MRSIYQIQKFKEDDTSGTDLEDYTRLIVETQPASPALPLSMAQILAHTCGSLLYTLELSAFVEGQCQRVIKPVCRHLTRREQEVLELICRGFDQQIIATMLSITPKTVDTHRKRICEKFDVHCETALFDSQTFLTEMY